MTPPPPAYFVVASELGRKVWLLGPYPDRPAAGANLARVAGAGPGVTAPWSPVLANVRVATAPAGVAITTVYGA